MKNVRLAVTTASLVVAATSLWPADASAAILQKPRGVSAFYTPDDGYMHAIVAQTDGGIREVYFVDQSFVASGVIARFGGVVGVSGYYTPVDHYRHVIVALANGQLWEVFYNPEYGIFQDLLTTVDSNRFGSILSVAGWVTPDATQNVVVLTTGGDSGVLHYSYYTHPLALESVTPAPTSPVDITAWCDPGEPGSANGPENFVSAIGTNAGSPPWILTYAWPVSGSLATASVTWNTGPSASILSLGGITHPGLASMEDVLYLDGNDHVEEDFAVPGNSYGGSPGYAVSVPGTPFSVGAAIESSGRRHAVVATSAGLIDFYATGTGLWQSYWLGTY